MTKRTKWLNRLCILLLITLVVYAMLSLKDLFFKFEPLWGNDSYQNYLQLTLSFILCIIYIIYTFYKRKVEAKKAEVEKKELEEVINQKILVIESLNRELSEIRVFDADTHIWEGALYMEYLKQIFQKDMGEFRIIEVALKSEEDNSNFLNRLKHQKDVKTIVFENGKYQYKLIIFKTTDEEFKYLIKDSYVLKDECFNTKTNSLEDVYRMEVRR